MREEAADLLSLRQQLKVAHKGATLTLTLSLTLNLIPTPTLTPTLTLTLTNQAAQKGVAELSGQSANPNAPPLEEDALQVPTLTLTLPLTLTLCPILSLTLTLCPILSLTLTLTLASTPSLT